MSADDIEALDPQSKDRLLHLLQEGLESTKRGDIKAWDPTVKERIASGLQSGLEALGMNRYGSRRAAQTITGGPSSNMPAGFGFADVAAMVNPVAAAAMVPIYAEEGYHDLKRASDAVKRGDLIDAGVEGVFGLANMLPVVPQAKNLIKGAKSFKRAEDLPKESRYETGQEGAFYRVKPKSARDAGSKDRGIREEVRQADTVAGSVGVDVPKSISDEDIRSLIKEPSNFIRQSADAYSQSRSGKKYELPDMPTSSLAKQSAIGRAFQLAAEGSPEYKQAVFEAYGRKFPKLVQLTGAQNYDQLMEASYRQLAKETADQFHTLPVNMSYHRAGEGTYDDSLEMLRDVYGNRHLYVYQGGDPHDFLNAIDPETKLNSNEMFRAIHDFYGHGVHGNQFGPVGEEIAYGAHSQMFSPLARMAMASETRGQNSFVNYTPINAELKARINFLNGLRYEANRRGKTSDVAKLTKDIKEAWGEFQYAPQKSVLLPPEFLATEYKGGMPDYVQTLITPEAGTTATERLTHFSHSPELTTLDPTRYGTGIKGREMERLMGTENPVMERSYFYTGDPSQIRKEAGLGVHRYGTTSENLYDVAQDPVGFRTLASESSRTPWTARANKGMADPMQAQTDVERMIKEYGYEGMINPEMGMGITFKPTAVQPFARGGLAALRRR